MSESTPNQYGFTPEDYARWQAEIPAREAANVEAIVSARSWAEREAQLRRERAEQGITPKSV